MPFDHRADLYSLGCALVRLLTGKTPFPATSVPAMMLAHLQQPPPHVTEQVPSLPTGLDSVIARAMAKDPANRFQTAGQLAAAATEALHGGGGQMTAPWRVIPSGDVSSYPSAPADAPWWQPLGDPRTMMTPVGAPPAYPGMAPPAYRRPRVARRRHRWIIAALTVLLLVVAGVTAGVLTRSSEEPTGAEPTTPTTVPPVPMADLKGLLLTTDQIGAILGSKLDPTPIGEGIGDDSDYLVEKECAEPWYPAERVAYTGSGWQDGVLQVMGRPELGPPQGVLFPSWAIQALVSFPVADLAGEFLAGQKKPWAQCANRKVTDLTQRGSPMEVVFGDFAVTDDGALTITWRSPITTASRVLAVRNNIAIDVTVYGKDTALDRAVDIVHKIAARIRQ
jgi:eukaryotic-like serine/threonine-protein kinase